MGPALSSAIDTSIFGAFESLSSQSHRDLCVLTAFFVGRALSRMIFVCCCLEDSKFDTNFRLRRAAKHCQKVLIWLRTFNIAKQPPLHKATAMHFSISRRNTLLIVQFSMACSFRLFYCFGKRSSPVLGCKN